MTDAGREEKVAMLFTDGNDRWLLVGARERSGQLFFPTVTKTGGVGGAAVSAREADALLGLQVRHSEHLFTVVGDGGPTQCWLCTAHLKYLVADPHMFAKTLWLPLKQIVSHKKAAPDTLTIAGRLLAWKH